jgi:hypothetical protein
MEDVADLYLQDLGACHYLSLAFSILVYLKVGNQLGSPVADAMSLAAEAEQAEHQLILPTL